MMGSDYWHPHWGNHNSWQWHLKFAWLPAKMDSGILLWFKEYYHGIRVIESPGTPVILHQYMTPHEYLFYTLKQS